MWLVDAEEWTLQSLGRNQCLAEWGLAGIHQNSVQDFDLNQVQRKEGLVHFNYLTKSSLANAQSVFFPAVVSWLPLKVEWHQLCCLLRSKNQDQPLHFKVMYFKRQTQHQRLLLVMQMTAGEICLRGFFSIYSLILGSNKCGERKHLNSISLHLLTRLMCWTQQRTEKNTAQSL